MGYEKYSLTISSDGKTWKLQQNINTKIVAAKNANTILSKH